MATINRIDGFRMITISDPDLPHKQIETWTRSGVNDVMERLVGVWAPKTEIITTAEATSEANAKRLLYSYRTREGNFVRLTIGGYSYVVERLLFRVHQVRMESVDNFVKALGPNGLYYAKLTARWVVQPRFM